MKRSSCFLRRGYCKNCEGFTFQCFIAFEDVATTIVYKCKSCNNEIKYDTINLSKEEAQRSDLLDERFEIFDNFEKALKKINSNKDMLTVFTFFNAIREFELK